MSKPGDKEMHDASESQAQGSDQSSQEEDEEEFEEAVEKKAAIMRKSGGTEAATSKHVTVE